MNRVLQKEEKVLLTVLSTFVASAKKDTGLLTEYKENVIRDPSPENFVSYRIQAHALKASLRSIGSDLFDRAYALEMAGKEERLEPIRNDSDAFAGDYSLLAGRLKEITGECDAVEDFDEEAFFGLLEKTDASMQAFDVTALQETFEKLQAMDAPEQYRSQLQLLETAVRDLDSDMVAECCGKIRELRKTN